MVEGIIARQVNHFQSEVARLQLRQMIVTVDVARQRFRALIAEVEANATAVVVEVGETRSESAQKSFILTQRSTRKKLIYLPAKTRQTLLPEKFL